GKCQELLNKGGRIFICTNELSNEKSCISKIATKGPTGNIINHLAVVYQIFKSTPVPRKSTNQNKLFMPITQEKQKHLEFLLYEWIILGALPISMLETSSFWCFINNLMPIFNIPNHKRFQNKIFESKTYVSLKSSELLEHEASWLKEVILAIKYLPYPHSDNSSNMKKALNQISWIKRVSYTAYTIQLVVGKGMLSAKVLIARAKRLISFFTRPKQNERLINVQKQYAVSTDVEEKSINESQLVFYHALTDCETRWSSTFNAWGYLLILKLFIEILSTTMNVTNADAETKKDGKQLKKINLTFEECSFINEVMPILGLFAETIERLKGSQYSTISYIYPAIQKIKSRLSFFVTMDKNDSDNENDLEDAFDKLQIEDDAEDDKLKSSQKRLRTKLYGESLFNSYSSDVDKVDKYLTLQEISKDQNALTW
ncbi:2582_t:CDS:2, partial [Cetraspora pellucida]